MTTVIGPCLACGDACSGDRVYSGIVGPFCTVACRDKNDDLKLWERANAYAGRVRERIANGETGRGLAELYDADVARAFVIGYASGLEDASSVSKRRTVKR